jgi:hypothetical protein
MILLIVRIGMFGTAEFFYDVRSKLSEDVKRPENEGLYWLVY